MMTNIRYIILTAFRDLLFSGLVLAVLIASLLSAILGNTTLLEKEAMTVVFSASSVRIILMLGLIVFVGFSLRHAFEHKEIDVLTSRPLSRWQIILSYWAGYACVGSLLVLIALFIMSFLPIGSSSGFYAWGAALLLESWLVVAAALFAGFTIQSGVASVLAVTGIYVLGRMMGFFLATAASPTSNVFEMPLLNQLTDMVLEGIAIFVPRLDLFTQSDWLVYGVTRFDDFYLALWQAAIYVPLLLVATVIDFRRKEF